MESCLQRFPKCLILKGILLSPHSKLPGVETLSGDSSTPQRYACFNTIRKIILLQTENLRFVQKIKETKKRTNQQLIHNL